MLTLQLLGPPALVGADATPLPLWRTHVALLARVALARGSRLPREAAARLLWPDADDQGARLSLRQALFRLRRDAGDLLAADQDEVRLDPGRVRVDVHEFEEAAGAGRADAAADTYRGDFLSGFLLPDNREFEQWLDGERARLRTLAAAMLRQAVDDATARGAWEAAIRRAEQWHRHFPLNDAAAERLIALYAQTGDRQRAILTYQVFARRLHEELDVTPGRRVEQIVERIRRVSRPLGRVSMVATASQPAPELPFVGRAHEFAGLTAAWRDARGGHRRVVRIRGAAGIGRSRLAREFAQWARLGGATVLAGRAYPAERVIPFAALADALRGAADAPGIAATSPVHLADAGAVLPRLAERFGGTLPPRVERPAATPRLLDAIRGMVEALAEERGVLLALDDASHADAESLATLAHVARVLACAPLMLLLTEAEEDGPSPLDAVLAPLAEEAPAPVLDLTLGPLTPGDLDELAVLVEHPGNEPDWAGEALARTGGHPARLAELLRRGWT